MLMYSAREEVTRGPMRGILPASISARIFAGSGGGEGRMVATSNVNFGGAGWAEEDCAASGWEPAADRKANNKIGTR